MSPDGSASAMRIGFSEELAALEAGLQEEGDLVLRALRSSLNALARADMELADEVISFDDEVDKRYVAIEEGVQSLLARQTPVAADLRLVLAILRVNLHLERMADYCVTVAKLTKLMGDLNVSEPAIAGSIEDMGQRAEQMIRVALDSFADRDPDKALTLAELDELIVQLNKSLGTTIVVVSHELPSIFTIADRCIMLDGAAKQIIAEGDPRELRERNPDPRVHAFFNRQPVAHAERARST